MALVRHVPQVGMAVRVMHLGVEEEAAIEQVLDDGHTLVVAGARFTLRRLNGRFVLDGEPYYGVWLSLTSAP